MKKSNREWLCATERFGSRARKLYHFRSGRIYLMTENYDCFNVRDIKSRNNPALDIIFADYSNVEVIGNIYDNPELLEGS